MGRLKPVSIYLEQEKIDFVKKLADQKYAKYLESKPTGFVKSKVSFGEIINDLIERYQNEKKD